MNAAIVLRYGEIFLKLGNRGLFEARLVQNAKRAVEGIRGAKVTKIHGRVLVAVDAAEDARAVERLSKVFGVQTLSPARLVEKDLEAISAEAVRVARASVERRGDRPTFKVETRRNDKRFPMASTEVSREVGARILTELGLRVDVHHPQLEVGVEIGMERCFVFAEKLPGPGGLPVGSVGRANLLLSGGIDSPVAGWAIARRGMALDATYFHSFPYTGDRSKEKVIQLARLLVPWIGPFTLNVVGFTDVQKALREAGPAELAVVLYRRMMFRAAAKIAEAAGAKALVTGESLAQVASQTLENMAVIDEASPLLVLRPLLANDKNDTIAVAKRIGTFETSILPYEDCCSLFVPSHPATKARLHEVSAAESKVDVSAMASMLADTVERVSIT